MQVLKVLNNSLVLAVDEAGSECILMGKGIGYQQSLGDQISDHQIQKVFILKDKRMLNNFIQLANELDETYFSIVKEIIDYAQQTYQMEVMDYIYLSLTDHLSFAVNRYKQGETGENFNYVEVIRRYPDEYDVGKYALNIIEEKLGIDFPMSEASAIALHFVNAKLNSSAFQREEALSKLVSNIERIVSRSIKQTFDRDSFSYSRFLTHLTYFAERILDNTMFAETHSDGLYDSMAEKMPYECDIIGRIAEFIELNYKFELTKQERIYLLVHLHRIIAETNER